MKQACNASLSVYMQKTLLGTCKDEIGERLAGQPKLQQLTCNNGPRNLAGSL